jgi:hypothetical protein
VSSTLKRRFACSILLAALLLAACGGGEGQVRDVTGLGDSAGAGVRRFPRPGLAPVAPSEIRGKPGEGWVTTAAMRRWQRSNDAEALWVAGYFLRRDWPCDEVGRESLVLRWKLVSEESPDFGREKLVGEALAALEGPGPEGLSNPLELVRLRVRHAHVEGGVVYLDFGKGIYATNSRGTCGGSAMAAQFVATVHHYFPEKREVCVLVEGVRSGQDGGALVFHDGLACPIPLHR